MDINKNVFVEKRELIHKGSILDYYKDTMRFSNGNTQCWDYIDHKPVVSVLPVDEDGNIICVRQYRHAIDKSSLEIPAGGIGDDNNPLTGALRELREETGYICDEKDAKHLIDIYTSVGYTNEMVYIYECKVSKKTNASLDDNEFVAVEKYSPMQLYEMIIKGEIQDAKTVSAVMTYIAGMHQ